MKQSCQSLSNKIKAFEKKYIERYIEDGSRLRNSEQTLNELINREKMINDIKSKVELY